MPNYIYCTLIMKGKKKDIDQVRTDICGIDEDNILRPIDFNKIIPMPPQLNVSHCETTKEFTIQKYIKNSVEKHLEIFLKAEGKESYQSKLLLAEKYFDNYQKYGEMTWYDWCVKNWGTKWNAIFDEDSIQGNTKQNMLFFSTAWEPPIPIMLELACKYPTVHFELEYFDEQDPEDTTALKFKLGEPKIT